MIRIRLFKKKVKEGGEGRSQFDGQWKVSMFGHYEVTFCPFTPIL
jgi:hypothetical protein